MKTIESLTCTRCGHVSLMPGRCDHCLEELEPPSPFQHGDGTFEQLSATEQVHAVRPLKPTLEDVLADCEALNDEIEHLKSVAQRAQAREAEAVKWLWELAWGVKSCLQYPRGSEAQVRCFEEVGQDAFAILKAKP